MIRLLITNNFIWIFSKSEHFYDEQLAGKGAYIVCFKCFCELLGSVVSDFIVVKAQIGEYLWGKGKMNSLKVGNCLRRSLCFSYLIVHKTECLVTRETVAKRKTTAKTAVKAE
jgi:hypothetical protein